MKKTFVGLSLSGLLLMMFLVGITGRASAASSSPSSAMASAGKAFTDRFHYEDTEEIEEFCGEPGLTVEHAFALDMFVHIVAHGPDGLDYYLQKGVWRDTYTHDGKTVTAVANVLEKDQTITDNGDGTLTIVILATGNATAYGPDGKAIARDPGQLRFVITIDADGNLTFGDVVKGSTGRSDDFCSAVVPALSG